MGNGIYKIKHRSMSQKFGLTKKDNIPLLHINVFIALLEISGNIYIIVIV